MEITKTITSIIELVPNTITSILEEINRKEPLSEDDKSELHLILEEALVNAIQHGNNYNTSLKVQTKITVENNLLTITVTDGGQGFDYNTIPNPLERNETLETAGRGIFLMKKMSNEVKFNETGSEITIIKKLRKGNKKK